MRALELAGLLVIGVVTVGAGLGLYRYGDRAKPLAIAAVLVDLIVAGLLLLG